jgi:hypothetical protein
MPNSKHDMIECGTDAGVMGCAPLLTTAWHLSYVALAKGEARQRSAVPTESAPRSADEQELVPNA